MDRERQAPGVDVFAAEHAAMYEALTKIARLTDANLIQTEAFDPGLVVAAVAEWCESADQECVEAAAEAGDHQNLFDEATEQIATLEDERDVLRKQVADRTALLRYVYETIVDAHPETMPTPRLADAMAGLRVTLAEIAGREA